MKRDKIPVWINVLSGIVVLILSVKAYSALFNPAMVYGSIDFSKTAENRVLWELAGRNISMIALGLSALFFQNALLLSACMLMGIFRESFDMFLALHFSSLSLNEILQALSFLIFILPYAAALKKLLVISRGETG
ncbi:MAG TPA: hypothetical protein PL048_03365 [Leptospiraceae bacterium]|nr:hypothetical protein [Leptospiraceae bacterium]HMY66780.1 hypothetical protein [Leptospiraceae bacterium]HMZ57788.1 hypothetical protein [Leptospiraceae bacterium]HNF12077.1 hypothetical protein [Leptospiraceae bacterium]HNF24660.1 hypothetical protein [Leptospiraceae bacterium]